MSVGYVRNVCLQEIQNRKALQSKTIMKSRSKKLADMKSKTKKNKLSRVHINHITCKETLDNQVGMTLSERAVDFSRSFPDKTVSSSTLERIYKKNKIKKKKVKVTKIPNRKERKKIKRSIAEAKKELEHYRSRNFRIIYLDETMITKSTIATHEWSKKNSNYKIDMKDYAK